MASRTYNQPFPAHSNYMLEQLNVQRYLGAFTDIIVRIGDVDFKLHRCLLAAACARFQSLLCNMREECGNVLVLKTVTPAGFRNVADFIYTGVVKLDDTVAQDALAAAQFFEMKDLEKVVLDYFKSVGSDAPEAAISLMRMSQGIGLNKNAGGGDNQTGSSAPSSASKFPPLPPPTWSHGKEGHPPFLPNMSNPEGSYFEDYLKMIESFESQSGQSEHTNQQRQEYIRQLSERAHKTFKGAAQNEQCQPDIGDLAKPIGPTDQRNLPNVQNNTISDQEYCTSNTKESGGKKNDPTADDDDEDDDCEVLCETGGTGDQAVGIGSQGTVRSREDTSGQGTTSIKQEAPDDEELGNFDSSGRREIAIQTITASFITRMKRKEDDRRGIKHQPRRRKKTPTKLTPGLPIVKRKRGRPRKIRPPSDEEDEIDDIGDIGGVEDDDDVDGLAGMGSDDQIKHRPLKKRLKEPKEKKKRGRKKKPKRTYECQKCARHFGKPEALRKHMKMHETMSVMYPCRVCAQKFARPTELTQHMRVHTGEVFTCKECDISHKDPRVHRKHMLECHQDAKPFLCTFPGCTFRSNRPSKVEKHAVIHSSVKTYGCPQCGKCFAQPNGLQSHLKSCYQRRAYQCDFCGQKFNYLQSMKSHRMLHTGEKPHQCSECGARFADQRNFKRHLRVHDGSNPMKSHTQHHRKHLQHNSNTSHASQQPVPQSLLPMGGQMSLTHHENSNQSQPVPQNMQLMSGLNMHQETSNSLPQCQRQQEPMSLTVPHSMPQALPQSLPQSLVSLHNQLPPSCSLSNAMSAAIGNLPPTPSMSSLHMSSGHHMAGHTGVGQSGVNLSHAGLQGHQPQMLSSLQMGAMPGGFHLPPGMLHLQGHPGPYDSVKSAIYEHLK